MENARFIIKDLNRRHAKFTVYTDIMYGRGINGVDVCSYPTCEWVGDGLKTKITRTFEPKDDYVLIIEDVVYPEMPWNRAAEKKPITRKKYIGYDRITYISETIEQEN